MRPHQKFGSPTADILMTQPLYKHQVNPHHPSRAREIARKKMFKKIAKKKKFKNFGYEGEYCQTYSDYDSLNSFYLKSDY